MGQHDSFCLVDSVVLGPCRMRGTTSWHGQWRRDYRACWYFSDVITSWATIKNNHHHINIYIISMKRKIAGWLGIGIEHHNQLTTEERKTFVHWHSWHITDTEREPREDHVWRQLFDSIISESFGNGIVLMFMSAHYPDFFPWLSRSGHFFPLVVDWTECLERLSKTKEIPNTHTHTHTHRASFLTNENARGVDFHA